MNNKKTTSDKQILNSCNPCLFTLRQEGQSFNKALLGQKQSSKISNDRIRIQLGVNPFLLLWCIEIKKTKQKQNKKQKLPLIKEPVNLSESIM